MKLNCGQLAALNSEASPRLAKGRKLAMQRGDDQLHRLRRYLPIRFGQTLVVQFGRRIVQQQAWAAPASLGKQFDLRDQQSRREQFLLAAGYSILDRRTVQSNAEFRAMRADLRGAHLLIVAPALLQGLGQALTFRANQCR